MGDLVTGGLGLLGAKQASGAEQRAAEDAARAQARGSRKATRQLAPFREAGVEALAQEQALLGLSGAPAQEEAFAAFTESPGQAFLRERGEQSLLRQSAALGGLGGGQVRSALQEQGIGFAQQDLQNQLARLSSLRAGGQQAASGIAGIATGAGAAQAQGIQQAAAPQRQFIEQATGVGVGALAGSGLSGSRAQAAFGGSAGAGALLGLL